jgi:hypothetical protein
VISKLSGIFVLSLGLVSCAVKNSEDSNKRPGNSDSTSGYEATADSNAAESTLNLVPEEPGTPIVSPFSPKPWLTIQFGYPTSPYNPLPTPPKGSGGIVRYRDYLNSPERRQSENVIDARPRPCANPKACPAKWVDTSCQFSAPLIRKYPANSPEQCKFVGQYQTGLCTCDAEGVLTTNCEVSERVCVDPSQTASECLDVRGPVPPKTTGP